MTDKAIVKAEREIAAVLAAGDAGKHAMHLLKMSRMRAEREVVPLQEAQDAAINAFAAAKDIEAQAMLATALEDVNKAFEMMAAAYMIDRTPIVFGQSMASTAWKWRLDQLVSNRLNVTMKSDSVLNKFKVDLLAHGVTDPGVKRFAKRENIGPSIATPDPVVTITFSDPDDALKHNYATAISR